MVLHVPYTYFPDPVGGTEVYVAGLVAALRDEDIVSAVAAPGPEDGAWLDGETPTFRFAIGPTSHLAQAYGEPDEAAAASFRVLLARLRPRVVHLHARTAAVSPRLIEAAGAIGARTVFTYHTPTVSCARGTMMRFGRSPCDGVLDRRRCTACTLAAHGVPTGLREGLAWMPERVGAALGRCGLAGGPFTALRMGALVGAAQRRFHELMRDVDRVVAVCRWVYEVLRANGVPADKLALCRQGLARLAPPPDTPRNVPPGRPLRLGYFGRLDPAKGVDILVEALARIPDAAVTLDIYGIHQAGCEVYAARLARVAAADGRISLRPALSPGAVDTTMRGCDLVAIPSRCLETGPLVVLEAFAAGTPVIGSRLGGIAELVRDEVDGVLVAPDDPDAWAAAIAGLAAAPDRFAALRARIRPPRTMREVAAEIAPIYRELFAADGN
jgi:glycosyltransferase involved in cell wall biosynthesis